MSEELKVPEVGDSVIFCDTRNQDHPALVTAVHGATMPVCMNLVHVSGDANRQDGFGRQVERPSSVPHVSQMNVHGYYWRYAHEERIPYQKPTT